MGTETDRNGLQWVPKRTGTDFSSYRNELQGEPEKVGLGTIGRSTKTRDGLNVRDGIVTGFYRPSRQYNGLSRHLW